MAWEYEPVEFTLEWTREGEPASAFRPDFYLPAHDLFIEITTLNQRLVTKKNRKVRRLRALHPDLKIKVLYQRDYQNLLLKYGLADGTPSRPGGGEAEKRDGMSTVTHLELHGGQYGSSDLRRTVAR